MKIKIFCAYPLSRTLSEIDEAVTEQLEPEIQSMIDRYGDLARVEVETYILTCLGELKGRYKARAENVGRVLYANTPEGYGVEQAVDEMLEPISVAMVEHLRETWRNEKRQNPALTPPQFAHEFAQWFVDLQETPIPIGKPVPLE